MKFLTVFLVSCAANAGIPELQAQIERHAAKGHVPAAQLAAEIYRQATAAGLEPALVAQIMLQESGGRAHAYNARTQDIGLMQINIKTAIALKLDATCLWNWQCNLSKSIMILKKFDRICRYNVGTAALFGRTLSNCLSYEQKLAILD